MVEDRDAYVSVRARAGSSIGHPREAEPAVRVLRAAPRPRSAEEFAYGDTRQCMRKGA